MQSYMYEHLIKKNGNKMRPTGLSYDPANEYLSLVSV